MAHTRSCHSLFQFTFFRCTHRISVLAFAWCLAISLPAWAQKPGSVSNDSRAAGPQQQVAAIYGKLPLRFEANRGQFDPRVQYASRGDGYMLSLSSGEAVLALTRLDSAGNAAPAVVRLQLAGSNRTPEDVPEGELPTKSNYLIGNDRSEWHTDIPNYRKVRYRGVYPGIDVVFYGNPHRMEHDFVVAAGADPGRIALRLQGISNLRIVRGDLVMQTPQGELRLLRPQIYQLVNGRRLGVSGGYLLKGRNTVGFAVGSFDRDKALVIDPVLSYSTYLGGSGEDKAWGIAVDASGDAYVVGSAYSTNFPTQNPIQGTHRGEATDVFVSKLSADGSTLIYSTYLGGTNWNDWGFAIAVNAAGEAHITGMTDGADFPIVNAFQPNKSGIYQAFVAKLNAAGTGLLYSSYLGGGDQDWGYAITLDSSGNAYVTGKARSTDFPLVNAIQSAPGSPLGNAFLTEVAANGSSLLYSTYLGGNNADEGRGIAVDASGNIHLTGCAYSTDFPVTANAYQKLNAGSGDAFVTVVKPDGSAPLYSTYLGGSGYDCGRGIVVDSSANVFVAGYTWGGFPATQNSFGGNVDAFVVKFKADGSAPLYSQYLGGSGSDSALGVAIDSSGNAYVTGTADSSNFPVVDAVQAIRKAGSDVFVTKLKADGSALLYSTFLGGDGDDGGTGIAVNAAGTAFVSGYTNSINFLTANALQTTNHGDYDALIVALSGSSGAPAVEFSPPSLDFANQDVNSISTSHPVTLTNTGTKVLTITSIFVSAALGFAETDNCGSSLAAGAACTFHLTFTPLNPGAVTGNLRIEDDAPGSPHSVSLSGTGIGVPAVSLSRSTVAFGSLLLGSAATAQTLTLTNTGTGNLTVTGISGPSDFPYSHDCAQLEPSASCTISVGFRPKALGSCAGNLTIASNASGSPHAVALSGTAADLVLSLLRLDRPKRSTAETVHPGAAARYDLRISAASRVGQSVKLFCEGLPAGATCAVQPATLQLLGPVVPVRIVVRTTDPEQCRAAQPETDDSDCKATPPGSYKVRVVAETPDSRQSLELGLKVK
jgi:hypothetical protein